MQSEQDLSTCPNTALWLQSLEGAIVSGEPFKPKRPESCWCRGYCPVYAGYLERNFGWDESRIYGAYQRFGGYPSRGILYGAVEEQVDK